MDAPRLLRITSPLGSGALILIGLRVEEEIGLPYRIEADVLGRDAKVKPSDLLAKEVTLKVVRNIDGTPVERCFHGVVTEFHRLGPGAARRMTYRLVVSPGIWKLGLKKNCRIFQDKSVKAIVDTVLKEHDHPAASWGILPELTPIPYCTQFNETDLHFVSRLLEEYGLAYHFQHSDSSHKLFISATSSGFPSFSGGQLSATHESPVFGDLAGWRQFNAARSASVKLEDMDKERSQPSVVIKKATDTRVYEGEPSMWAPGEVFRWPGGMSTRPELDNSKVLMGWLETASERFTAHTQDHRLTAGARLPIAVKAEDGSEETKQYIVTAVGHEAQDTSGLVAGAGGVETYVGKLEIRSTERVWMPEPRHERPEMAGVYSAKVTGPSGEKIHVDEFGRIKVKFRWDRLGKDDDSSSCWVRVMQGAAGAWGGAWFLPRVGDEVMVAFLDGDPDRPVVVGSVYGKDAKPPFQPGSNRSQSGYRTRSYKSDSAEDANILRFEDKKGEEEVLLHTQKDLKVEIENDEQRDIQNKRTTTITDSDDKLTLKKGDLSVKCELGKITMEAMVSITLKVGENTIVIDQMGITLKGLMITEQAQVMHQTQAPMLMEKGDAMVIINGGLLMLN
ncbi:type IV secretion protein Rhs [Alsobacter metallidurans]|uniref:Type IV secretion protein Rhs n=1 Tax=Alsobacter metallidurans TaxID=340221 RepID=A0A917MI11_9HYPH|nr:type VI secretion system tip protein TssI/VgrG [Alsobacter metallidurans]GGH20195.1 type IV secretion protein Rhs [Alsobacter metallidurans]